MRKTREEDKDVDLSAKQVIIVILQGLTHANTTAPVSPAIQPGRDQSYQLVAWILTNQHLTQSKKPSTMEPSIRNIIRTNDMLEALLYFSYTHEVIECLLNVSHYWSTSVTLENLLIWNILEIETWNMQQLYTDNSQWHVQKSRLAGKDGFAMARAMENQRLVHKGLQHHEISWMQNELTCPSTC